MGQDVNAPAFPGAAAEAPDGGLRALCAIAAYYRIAADPVHLGREFALTGKVADERDLVRAANAIGLKARIVEGCGERRLRTMPVPAIVRRKDGTFQIFGGVGPNDACKLVDPVTRAHRMAPIGEVLDEMAGGAVLVARRFNGVGYNPETFGFRWFLPSIWRYRKPLAHVLIASLFVQVFALVTPLFFQVVVDKVLTHRAYSTLFVLVAGIAAIGLFDVALQYLRTYALAHTTNRIDVELGQRLFRHLLRLPLGYFETRPAGQTVARVRELETIRSFLTGQGLFSAIDLVFTVLFIGVLWAYSWKLTLIVIGLDPALRDHRRRGAPAVARSRQGEIQSRGGRSQQFLVEAVVGIHTIKAGAVEPVMRAQWEEHLAAYVQTAFGATLVGARGQNAIQYVSKLSTAALLLFGAKAVIDNELTVGALVAFNMIAGQVVQPCFASRKSGRIFSRSRSRSSASATS